MSKYEVQRPEGTPARQFGSHGVWGDRMEWSTPQLRLHGWMPRRPYPGDVYVCPMQSGRTAAFILDRVEWCMDPDDMFFADTRPLGYVDEPDVAALLDLLDSSAPSRGPGPFLV